MEKECSVIFISPNNGDPIFKVKIENGEIYGPMQIGDLTLYLNTKYNLSNRKFIFTEFKNTNLTIDYLRIGLNKAVERFNNRRLNLIKSSFLKSIKENLNNSGIKLD